MANIEIQQRALAGAETRRLVDATKLPHKKIAHEMAVSPSTFSKTLSGRRQPSADDLRALELILERELGAEYAPGTLSRLWADVEDSEPRAGVVPDGEPADGPGDDVDEQPPGGQARKFILAAVLLMVLVVVGLLVLAPNSSDSNAATAEVMAHCDPSIGDLADTVSAGMADWVVPLRTRFSRALSDYNWPCPIDLARPVLGRQALAQELEDRDGARAIVVASSETRAVTLPADAWTSLLNGFLIHEILDIGEAQPPWRIEPHVDHSRIAMANSTAVGETLDDPHFLLPQPMFAKWDELGGSSSSLGRPMTHPYLRDGRIEIAFERGLLVADPDAIESVAVVDDRTSALPRAVDPEWSVVVTPDGTHWLLDQSARHWISNPDVLTCLALDPVPVSGQALARVQSAHTAECANNN